MARRWRAVLVLGLALGFGFPRLEGQQTEGRIDGVEDRTQKLLELPWYRVWSRALSASQCQRKPILWLQMVGDLDDGL